MEHLLVIVSYICKNIHFDIESVRCKVTYDDRFSFYKTL